MSAALRQAATASGDLPVGGVGAAELVHRPPRRCSRRPAVLDRGRDIGGRDVRRALDVGRLVGIGGIGGDPVAQHEIGRLRVRQSRRRQHADRNQSKPVKQLPHGGRLRRPRRRKFKAQARSRAAPARPRREARNRNSRSDCAALPDAAIAPGGKHRRRLQLVRDRADDLDTRDLLQFADLLHGQIGLAGDQPFGGKARRNDGRPGVDLGCDAHPLDQLRKQDAAGADPRIGHRTGGKQCCAQRRLGCDIGMGDARLHRDADIGPREVHAAIRHHAPLAGHVVQSLAGQDDDVGALAAAQAIQQRQCRREIGIDAHAAGGLIMSGQTVNRALQGQRREHAHGIVHGATPAASA